MRAVLTRESLAKAFAHELAAAMVSRLGVQRQAQPADNWRETRWHGAVNVSGEAIGAVPVWLDDTDALLAALHPQAADGDAAAAVEIDVVMRDLIEQAARSTARQQAFRGIEFGAIVIGAQAITGVPLTALAVEVTEGQACQLAAGAEVVIHVEADERLEAVLDVSLPLVARFGHTTMPMRALAALGPGAIVDLDRAPEDPVELLVGGRVVAKGEVVIIGGNYGVRILEVIGAAKLRQQMESVR